MPKPGIFINCIVEFVKTVYSALRCNCRFIFSDNPSVRKGILRVIIDNSKCQWMTHSHEFHITRNSSWLRQHEYFWRLVFGCRRVRFSHCSCCPRERFTGIVWYWSRHGQYSLCFVARWEQTAYFHCPTSTYTASTFLLWSRVALVLLSSQLSRTHHEWIWFPICLSRFHSHGFLYAYINCLDRDTNLMLVLLSQEKFDATVSTLSPCRNRSSAAIVARQQLGLPQEVGNVLRIINQEEKGSVPCHDVAWKRSLDQEEQDGSCNVSSLCTI
jgi:hypothetical protein